MNFVIIEQTALYVPLILGAYLTISLMKIPNLSIETAYVFGAIIASLVLQFEGCLGIEILITAIILSACAGAIVGVVSAIFSEVAKFSLILSSIITIGLFHGISLWILGGSHCTIAHLYNPLKMISTIQEFPELAMIVLIVCLVVILFSLFLKTQLGISCALYGDNIHFLKSYRMNQSYVVIAGMAIGNALAGISGYMVAQSNGFVDTMMGVGLPLVCLSSLIIGKTICYSSKPIQMGSAVVGVIGYFVIQKILLKSGFDLRYFTTIQAIIVAALLILFRRYISGSTEQNLLGI
jgi:putative ABC transport system permease protein